MNSWTLHYLLSFGRYVEILEPEAARDAFREYATGIVRIYEEDTLNKEEAWKTSNMS